MNEKQQYEARCQHCDFIWRTEVTDNFELSVKDIERRAIAHAEFAQGHAVEIFRHSFFQKFRQVRVVSPAELQRS